MTLLRISAVTSALTQFVVATAALSLTQVASAAVVPSDSFTFSIAGYNSSSGLGYIRVGGESAVFGQTTTFADVGYNRQAYTISSYEVVGSTTTTDYFKVTTPTNFLTSTAANGITITALQFDLGDSNSGNGVAGGTNPVNVSSAIDGFSVTGSMVFGSDNIVFPLIPSANISDDGLSLAAAEGVNAGTSAISTFAIHEFDFAISYATPVAAAPEADTVAMLLVGLGMIGYVTRRSKKGRIKLP